MLSIIATRGPRLSDHVVPEGIDTAIQVTALLVRAGAYAVVGGLASQYDCGQAMLTGLLVGDLSASAALWLMQGHELWQQSLAELALLAIIYLCVRHQLVWPDDPAQRAIVGLAALGVFAPRAGGALMARFGPGEDLYG